MASEVAGERAGAAGGAASGVETAVIGAESVCSAGASAAAMARCTASVAAEDGGETAVGGADSGKGGSGPVSAFKSTLTGLLPAVSGASGRASGRRCTTFSAWPDSATDLGVGITTDILVGGGAASAELVCRLAGGASAAAMAR